jgi:6-phosphogluconolactonase (cycloisomerase 2 family)
MYRGKRLLSRSILKSLIRIVPAVVAITATIYTISCGTPGLGLGEPGSGAASSATPTPGTGALAFVSNFTAGNVASFTRNTTTGLLKRTAITAAGKKSGPRGLAVSPGAAAGFLYVANRADDNIYEYAVNQNSGVLTPLSPASISNGTKSGPDEIAINPAGTFLFATGFNKGTVTSYSINTSTGQLTMVKTKVMGLTNPLGIAVDSAGSFVYVADQGAGVVNSYSIDSTTGVLTRIGSVFDLNGVGGSPQFIAFDPGGKFIYVTDLNAGLIAVLNVNAGVLSFGQLVPAGTGPQMPIGIAVATVSTIANFLFTANQGTSTLWSFQLLSPGFPAIPVEFALGGELNLPAGVAVDPQNAFLYATNQGAGTVSQFSLTPACFASPGAPCFVSTVSTGSGSTGGPFGIILAN